MPIDPRFQLVRMESVRMMVAKATAQDKGFAARRSSRSTYPSPCFPPALRETALAWQQILSDRGQNTLIAPSNAKKRQPGPEICPLTSPRVRWGGAGGAARQDSVGSWPLDLPPRAGITAPYLPYTTYRHESCDIR